MRRIWIILLVVVLLTACVAENNPPVETTGGDTTVGNTTTDAGTTAPVTTEPTTTEPVTTEPVTTGPFDGIIEEGDVIVFNEGMNVAIRGRELVDPVPVTREEFSQKFAFDCSGLSETADYAFWYKLDVVAVKPDLNHLEYGRIAICPEDGKSGYQYNLFFGINRYFRDFVCDSTNYISKINGYEVKLIAYSMLNDDHVSYYAETMMNGFYFTYYFTDCSEVDVVRLMKDFIVRNQTAE